MQINMYILAFTNIFITLQIASKPYTLISEQWTYCDNNSSSVWRDDVCIKRGSWIGWRGSLLSEVFIWDSDNSEFELK